MKKILVSFFLLAVFITTGFAQETISIKGRVTDYNGNPIDSCAVNLLYSGFSVAYETVTDKDGYYILDNVEKGRYLSLYALRLKEYPREDAVPDEDKRLEFWAWNVIADRDLTINPRYHRLELYGTNVFQVEGGYPGMMIYTRPMSTGKLLSFVKEIVLDKAKAEQNADISVLPENFEVRVFADDEELTVNSIQSVIEYAGEENLPLRGFIINVDKPKGKPDKPYIIFRVEGYDKEYGERGENLYFYEIKNYKQNPVKK